MVIVFVVPTGIPPGAAPRSLVDRVVRDHGDGHADDEAHGPDADRERRQARVTALRPAPGPARPSPRRPRAARLWLVGTQVGSHRLRWPGLGLHGPVHDE